MVNPAIGGGYPPRLTSIENQAAAAAADDFVKALFWRYDNAAIWSHAFKRLLGASVLMYLKSFIDLLLQHPHKKFGATSDEAWTKHPFLQKLQTAAQNASIAPSVLLEWGAVVERDFIERNIAFAPFNRVAQVNPRMHVVDDRSLLSGVVALADAVGGNTIQTRQMRDVVREHSADWMSKSQNLVTKAHLDQALKDQEKRIVKRLTKEFYKAMHAAVASGAALGTGTATLALGTGTATLAAAGVARGGLNNEEDSDEDVDEEESVAGRDHRHHAGRLVPSAPITKLYIGGLKEYTVCGLFQEWHVYGHYQLIYKKNTVQQRQHRSIVLLVIQYFSLFLSRQPSPLPTGAPTGSHPNAKTWRKELMQLINQGWQRVISLMQKHKVKSDKVSAFKTLMFKVGPSEWPEGPTGETPFQPVQSHNGTLVTVPLLTRQKLVEHHNRQKEMAERKLVRKQEKLSAAASQDPSSDEDDNV
jgi:hypothetical protein